MRSSFTVAYTFHLNLIHPIQNHQWQQVNTITFLKNCLHSLLVNTVKYSLPLTSPRNAIHNLEDFWLTHFCVLNLWCSCCSAFWVHTVCRGTKQCIFPRIHVLPFLTYFSILYITREETDKAKMTDKMGFFFCFNVYPCFCLDHNPVLLSWFKKKKKHNNFKKNQRLSESNNKNVLER